MRQALHIFKKDALHLRWDVAALFALTAGLAIYGSRVSSTLRDANGRQILDVLVPIAWALLTVRLIHSEALPGHRQFWLTRPYEWRSLLAAKILFLLVFVTLPMMLCDITILTAQGFRVTDYLPGLLCEQVLRWMLVILPAIALAAVTARLAAFIFSALLIIAILAISPAIGAHIDPWGDKEWILLYGFGALAAAGCLAIATWQYARRRTAPARAAFGCIVLLCLTPMLPARTGSALQELLSANRPQDSSVIVSLGTPEIVTTGRNLYSELRLPLEVSGVPPGLEARIDGSILRILNAQGAPLPLGAAFGMSFGNQGAAIESGPGSLHIFTPRGGAMDRLKSQAARVQYDVWLTLYRPGATAELPLGHRQVPLPSAGLCDTTVGPPLYVICKSPFRGPRVRVNVNSKEAQALNGPGEVYAASYSPLPADFSIMPVTWFAAEPEVTLQYPVSHLRRRFEAPIHLE